MPVLSYGRRITRSGRQRVTLAPRSSAGYRGAPRRTQSSVYAGGPPLRLTHTSENDDVDEEQGAQHAADVVRDPGPGRHDDEEAEGDVAEEDEDGAAGSGQHGRRLSVTVEALQAAAPSAGRGRPLRATGRGVAST